MIDNPRDWAEDAHLENGNYWNECVECRGMFVGLKGRTNCRLCHKKSVRAFRAMGEPEQEEAMRKRIQEIADWFSGHPDDPMVSIQER